MVLSGIAPLVSSGANYLGQARQRVPITLVTLGVATAAALVLIPRVGVVGAAIAIDIAYAVYVPAHLWLCLQALGLPLRPLLITLGRSLAAAGAMALVLVAVGTNPNSLLEWAVGGFGGAAAYVAALLATRELTWRELRGLVR
jgi:O-antigen/teichoic acid export membrane protein